LVRTEIRRSVSGGAPCAHWAEAEDGLKARSGAVPDCVTTAVWPPIVKTALRDPGLEFELKLNCTTPGPEPVEPPEIERNEEELVWADQAQLASVTTPTEPVPAVAPTIWLAGARM
jgi:hypothetical protein